MVRFFVTTILSLFLISLLIQTNAQSQVWHTGIAESNVNVRGNPVVFGQIDIDVTDPGRVVVRFDGNCYADVGDRIIIGASDHPDWGTNDGNIGIESIDNDINHSSFSHTRVYDITAGSHSFYAVAENYVEQDGNGMTSIYGSLTVEYFPDLTWVEFQGIQAVNVDVRGNPVTVGQVTLNAPSNGKAVVHFDGSCYADVGDRIILAASDHPDWVTNDGNLGIEVYDSDINHAPFSHTRVYDVTAGSHDFYAVAENYVEQGGSGIASIYASLTVEFFPNITGEPFADFQGIAQGNVNVRGNPVVVGQININPANTGKVVVHFDGSCYADVGDLIVLAASDHPDWGVNDGNTGIEVYDTDLNHSSFSHTRVYDVASGSQDFYAVAENYVEQDGSGIASFYSSLVVKYYPDAVGDVRYSDQIPAEYSLGQNYPNPFNPATKIRYQVPELSFVTLKVYDVLGNEVTTLINEEKTAGHYEVFFNAADLSSGIYFYSISAGKFQKTRKMTLIK